MKTFNEVDWNKDWKTVGLDVQYKMDSTETKGILRVYFAPSNSSMDWRLNFDFAVVPYRDMETEWKAHRGFVKAWKSGKEEIVLEVQRHQFRSIEVYGYSLGGALAQLATEDFAFRKLGDVHGKSWGSPKVFWGMPKILKDRMQGMLRIEARTDLVARCPPGYQGGGEASMVGKGGMARCKGHEPVNYMGS